MSTSSTPITAYPHPRTVAIILAAGQGTRMGAAQNKVFLPLAGKPLLVHTIEAFQRAHTVDEILLVAHPREVDYCATEIVARYELAQARGVIAGGETRHQSEDRALAALRAEIDAGAITIILFHDGARPLVSPNDIDTLVTAARETGGALLATATPADEVIARVGPDGSIAAIYPSADLWRAQTPQAFDARTLLAAYDRARSDGFEGTDTASSYERLGLPVRVVPGSAENFKVTTPQDLLRAEAILRNRVIE